MANLSQAGRLTGNNGVPAGRCCRCKVLGPLADSHIVPAAFFRQIQQGSPFLLQLGNDEGATRQKIMKGSYVKDILCPACDNWLNTQYEQYAIRVFVRGRGVTLVHYIQEDIHLCRLDAVDLDRIKLFLLSVLWRAHKTQAIPCTDFDLGTSASRIEQMVLDGDAGTAKEFAVIPARYDLCQGILMPFPCKLEGLPYWGINLGDWEFLIKASDRPCPPPFEDFELRGDRPCFVLPIEFLGSATQTLMTEILLLNKERRECRRG